MITFANVSVRYPHTPTDTIRDVSLTAAPGMITALTGPNGSGKSTLVRAMLRRIPLLSGSISINGYDLTTQSPRDFARQVAVVTQREDTSFSRTVREYLSLGNYPNAGTWATTTNEPALVAAAQRADISHFLDRNTQDLSGGEWQRVRIARALVQQTPIIVLDEPTTFLDIAHEMATFELMASLAQEGRTILLISHQLNLVARFAHHIVLLHQGQVAIAGPPDTIMRGEILEPVYDWPLVITRDPAMNAPTLVPLRRR